MMSKHHPPSFFNTITSPYWELNLGMADKPRLTLNVRLDMKASSCRMNVYTLWALWQNILTETQPH